MSSPPGSPIVSHVRDVILRHGRTLRLRPPLPDDAEAVLDFFRRLDDQSLYMRFHGTRRIGHDILDGLLDPDWSVRGALIGLLRGDTGDEVVAVASYARLRDPRLAEAAFAVATDLQGLGVGTRLVEQLAEAAAQEGIETFVADVMAENDAMLQVFADTGYDVERTFESGEILVRLRIAPSDRFLDAVDRRDHTAVDRSLESFFRPQTVAVIGASARPGAIGGAVFRNIVEGGFTGRAFPVNRSGEPVAGVAAVHSIEELAEPIDLVVICVPAAAVYPAVESALAAGVRAVCVITAGFAETGPDGARAERELLALVRSYGARMIGPNCLGSRLERGAHERDVLAGRLRAGGGRGLVAERRGRPGGARGARAPRAWAFRHSSRSATRPTCPRTTCSSTGRTTPHTDIILLYLESFGNPRRFARIARRVRAPKPIIAVKGGRTQSARAPRSRTRRRSRAPTPRSTRCSARPA